ncbi:hypothetical protein DL96DRAFT_118395 [Flagelloscypha sp. PMI_526]|nr:hypothetical protein DL96DRAFT_118395 [Flagelloscypha sp. PMI_526]
MVGVSLKFVQRAALMKRSSPLSIKTPMSTATTVSERFPREIVDEIVGIVYQLKPRKETISAMKRLSRISPAFRHACQSHLFKTLHLEETAHIVKWDLSLKRSPHLARHVRVLQLWSSCFDAPRACIYVLRRFHNIRSLELVNIRQPRGIASIHFELTQLLFNQLVPGLETLLLTCVDDFPIGSRFENLKNLSLFESTLKVDASVPTLTDVEIRGVSGYETRTLLSIADLLAYEDVRLQSFKWNNHSQRTVEAQTKFAPDVLQHSFGVQATKLFSLTIWDYGFVEFIPDYSRCGQSHPWHLSNLPNLVHLCFPGHLVKSTSSFQNHIQWLAKMFIDLNGAHPLQVLELIMKEKFTVWRRTMIGNTTFPALDRALNSEKLPAFRRLNILRPSSDRAELDDFFRTFMPLTSRSNILVKYHNFESRESKSTHGML